MARKWLTGLGKGGEEETPQYTASPFSSLSLRVYRINLMNSLGGEHVQKTLDVLWDFAHRRNVAFGLQTSRASSNTYGYYGAGGDRGTHPRGT